MNREQSIAELHKVAASRGLAEGRNFCIQLTQTYPQDIEIWVMRGGLHFKLGEYDGVVECARRVIALDAQHAGAHFSLGIALQNLKRMTEAEAAYRDTLHIHPAHSKALAQFIGMLTEQNRLAEVRTVLDNALAHAPKDALLHYNLGMLFLNLGQQADAKRAFEQAVAFNPALSEAHYYLGLLHYRQQEYNASITWFLRACMLTPTAIEPHRMLGAACVNAGRVLEAAKAYEHLAKLAPNDADAHTCAAMCHLMLGNFARGWPEYEWRLKTNYMAAPPTGMPRWNGQPLNGKTILINAEQGHGDTVQFVRYAREVKACGGNVILGCQPALRRLLASCAGVDRVVCHGEPAPPYHVLVTLLSLPGMFKTTLETIPAEVPYLTVPSGAGAQAVALIARHAGVLRVGLVWAGGIHTQNRHRSLTLEHFKNLLGVAGTKFFSLQKDAATAELKLLPADTVVDLDPYLSDFADTAAAIQALDLIISVDTAVAHVAGALSRPVWTLLPFAPDWRWMLNRDDSLWYPSMRLFRQPAVGDWNSVIERVAAQLTVMVQTRSATV